MDQGTTRPAYPRRRDLRKQDAEAQIIDRQDRETPAVPTAPAAEDIAAPLATVTARPTSRALRRRAANAPLAFRGSDGSAVRELKRRRLATVSGAASVAAAGSALLGVLLSGHGTEAQAQVTAAGADLGLDSTTAIAPEVLDGAEEITAAAEPAGGASFIGGVPSAEDREAEAASRSVTRTVLPGCSGEAPGSMSGITNGELPENWLCDIGIGGHKLRADAALSFAEMNAAYKADTGKEMEITDSYRTMESQISVASRKPGLAARPGTSLHGWGIALDMGGGAATATGTQYDWLVAHGAEYGWENPDWAKSSKYEPWHWEYVPARKQIRGA
ncbi:M15 family metallopeptidase [Brevibacterium samyangense]|uniref:D-alanyl-D-alanine carboxypeptidase-like core domain-containing protein n=1 Tax=Brevibacterium samyangense TaxID=366888 RepID=A0ABN2T9E8_9MICO